MPISGLVDTIIAPIILSGVSVLQDTPVQAAFGGCLPCFGSEVDDVHDYCPWPVHTAKASVAGFPEVKTACGRSPLQIELAASVNYAVYPTVACFIA